MVNIFKKLYKYKTNILMTLFVMTVAVVFIYEYEKRRAPTTMFNYYGDVTTKLEYRGADDKIESMAFGENISSKKFNFLFRNELWCRKIGTGKPMELISVKADPTYDFNYWNTIDPARLSRGIIRGEYYQIIPTVLAKQIRKEFSNGTYGTWLLNNERPEFDSTCQIIAYGSTKTPIFGFEKTVVSTGNLWDYFVDEQPAEQPAEQPTK